MTDVINLEAVVDSSVQLKVKENVTELEIQLEDTISTEVGFETTIYEIQTDNEIQIEVITDADQLIVPGTNRVTYTAGETVYGGRIVELNSMGEVKHASSTGTGFGIIGLATQAGNAGNRIEVVTFGSFTDSSFNFIPDEPIFLRENGIISQTPPSTGVTLVVGSAITSTSIFIRVEQPIYMIDEI